MPPNVWPRKSLSAANRQVGIRSNFTMDGLFFYAMFFSSSVFESSTNINSKSHFLSLFVCSFGALIALKKLTFVALFACELPQITVTQLKRDIRNSPKLERKELPNHGLYQEISQNWPCHWNFPDLAHLCRLYLLRTQPISSICAMSNDQLGERKFTFPLFHR